MRTEEHSNRDDDGLHELLKSWHVDASLPPRFRENVWRKIARETASNPSRWRSGWNEFVSGCAAVLQRPAGAIAYLLTLMVVGTGLGYWQAERYSGHREATWRAAYVQSVNPYSTRPPQ